MVYRHRPSMRKALGLIPNNTHEYTYAPGNQLVGLLSYRGYVLGSALDDRNQGTKHKYSGEPQPQEPD